MRLFQTRTDIDDTEGGGIDQMFYGTISPRFADSTINSFLTIILSKSNYMNNFCI